MESNTVLSTAESVSWFTLQLGRRRVRQHANNIEQTGCAGYMPIRSY